MKQAPRAWNAKFTSCLSVIGFHSSHSDRSLFVKHVDSEILILLLYVDDLSSVFEMKDMDKLTYFLGLQVSYTSAGYIFVNQSKYVKDLLHKAGMSSC